MIMLDIVTRRWLLQRTATKTATAPTPTTLSSIAESIPHELSHEDDAQISELAQQKSVLVRYGPSVSPAHDKPRQTGHIDRDSHHATARKSAFTTRMTATVQTATVPLRRLVSRVMSRLPLARPLSQQEMKERGRQRHKPQQPSFTHVDSLKFIVWKGGECMACGWTLQRKFLLDETQFAWVVSHVHSVQVWEHTGLRPGDVLETIGGVAVATFSQEHQVTTLLSAAVEGTVLRFRVRHVLETCKLERFQVSKRAAARGVALIADGSDEVHMVAKVVDSVQRDGGGGGIAGLRPGDVLCDVAGTSVAGMGLAAVDKMVQECKQQQCLTFQRWTHYRCDGSCRVPSTMDQTVRSRSRQWLFTGAEFHDDSDNDGADDVVILWHSGPLGVTVKHDDNAKMPQVSRLTGKGSTPGVERIKRGYHLVSVNGIATRSRRFTHVVKELARVKKPVSLVFRAPQAEPVTRIFYRQASPLAQRASHLSSSSSLMSLDRYVDTLAA